MFMPPCEAVHGGMGGIKREDVMVMVSRGGKTSELLPLVDVVTKKGASLIAITENPDSPLAKAASVVLLMNVGKESDPLGLMATSSYVQTIAIFDALLAALIEETGYTAEQFGLIHPGGAVGEHINGKTI
jgi:D-arabinose 5-phosphate isomerase GutQ